MTVTIVSGSGTPGTAISASEISTSNKSTRLHFLDGIRGATAVYVLGYHFIAWVPSVLPRWITHLQQPLCFGHVAVSVFIVLSGFSLMLPVEQSKEKQIRGGFRGYIKRRALRIVPAYYAATLLAILVTWFLGRSTHPVSAPLDLTAGSLLTHALLIHNLFPAYVMTLNMAHWSVAAEWQIYFLLSLVFIAGIPCWRPRGTDLMWGDPGCSSINIIARTAKSGLDVPMVHRTICRGDGRCYDPTEAVFGCRESALLFCSRASWCILSLRAQIL